MTDRIIVDDRGNFEVTYTYYDGYGYHEFTSYIPFEEMEETFIKARQIRKKINENTTTI